MQLTYEGGHRQVAVVLPTRSLTVQVGDVLDVTDAEADRLLALPGWRTTEQLALLPGPPPADTDPSADPAATEQD